MTVTPDPKKVNLYARSDGNASRHVAKVATSSQSAADVVDIMPLAPGMEIDKVELLVTDAGAGTVDVGFKAKASDADYWIDGHDISNVGRVVSNAKPRRTVVHDEVLQLTYNAAQAAALEIYVFIEYRFPGNL